MVATTVRLWLRRRREALGGLFRRHRVIVPTVLATTALMADGLAVSFIGHASTAPTAGETAAQAGVLTGPVAQNRGAGAAATWVAAGCADAKMAKLLRPRGRAADTRPCDRR